MNQNAKRTMKHIDEAIQAALDFAAHLENTYDSDPMNSYARGYRTAVESLALRLHEPQPFTTTIFAAVTIIPGQEPRIQ